MKSNKLFLLSLFLFLIPLVNAQCSYTTGTIPCNIQIIRPENAMGTIEYFSYAIPSTRRVSVLMTPGTETAQGPDYDLYTSWTANTCPYTATYNSTDCGFPLPGAGIRESCSKWLNPLPAGTYWIAVHHHDGGCTGLNCGYKLNLTCQVTTTSTSTISTTSTTITTTTTRPTTTTTTIPQCIDSDNGKNYFVKGTCSGTNGVYTDYCTYGGYNYLIEYYCSGSTCLQEQYSCQPPYACYDGKCVYWDTTSSTTTTRTTTTIRPQPTTTTIRGGGGGGGGRMPLMIGVTEVLNNPIVILVALIAIVVIIYGAFKFFAMPKKHR